MFYLCYWVVKSTPPVVEFGSRSILKVGCPEVSVKMFLKVGPIFMMFVPLGCEWNCDERCAASDADRKMVEQYIFLDMEKV